MPTSNGRFYITTPIYYVNDAPHIGHAYTTVNCDAIARWHRLLGDDTYFLTGTDEHGLNVQRSAEANNRTPQEHADITSQRYRETFASLDISNDDYIRTSEPRHYAAVQALLSKIRDNGHIELDTYEGLYCVSCEDYYTDVQAPDGKSATKRSASSSKACRTSRSRAPRSIGASRCRGMTSTSSTSGTTR
jgi:methionyl-tRNA synthetase